MSDEVETTAPPAVQLDTIVDRYIQLRDKKTEIKAAYEKQVSGVDQALERIEAFLMKHLNDSESESVRTKSGTFFKSKRTSATVADWDSISAWVLEDTAARWAMLEKRVSKGFVEAFADEHNDIPPGVNIRTETTICVRRS